MVTSQGLSGGIDGNGVGGPAGATEDLDGASAHLYRWNQRLIPPRVGFYTPKVPPNPRYRAWFQGTAPYNRPWSLPQGTAPGYHPL